MFDDRPVARTHRLDALSIGVPFVSNLPAHIEVKVTPHLAFRLNGAAFDSGAEATPFAATRDAVMQLRVPELDLAPYVAYLPATLPLRLERGRASLDIALTFSQPPSATPTIVLSGRMSLGDAALALPNGQPFASWRALDVPLTSVQPLARRIKLGTVKLDAPRFALVRTADGRSSLLPTEAGAPAAAAAGPPWAVEVESFDVAGGALTWRDESTAPPAELRLDAIEIAVQRPAWPLAVAMPIKLSARLEPGATRLAVDGEASDRAARLALRIDQLAFAPLAPYLAQVLRPKLDGALSVNARIDWAAEPSALTFDVDSASASGLRLADGQAEVASLRELALSETKVDLVARRVSIGRVTVSQPAMRLERARGGTANVAQWAVAQPAAATGSAQPWRIAVGDFALDEGRVQVVDAVPAEPVRLDVSALRLGVQNFDSTPVKGAAPARVELSARLAPGVAPGRPRERGAQAARVEWRGQATLEPLSASGALRVERLPLALFEPYFVEQLNVDVLRADAGFRGNVSLRQDAKGFAATVAGDALLADVRVQTRPDPTGLAPDELLNWQAFTLKGLRVNTTPGQKPRVEVAEAELNDFFSKLVVTEQGRFNLREVAPPKGDAPAPSAPVPNGQGLPLDLVIGSTRLVNGRIDFSDRFIKPNYSAQLTELNGRLGRFASGSREMAPLELRGRAAGTALLDIRGSLNPTADPLALDIQAKATDLELAPLSPYAGKYAGYAIERGKLTMDVAYRIDPDGKLDARNQVILNQLTFGERIESPDATKLPVLLAVALLKDRNGVIDINLPVSGSINDPQFSVFGIVLKVIGNLLVKALTAPFALLAGGGSDDLSFVEFAPGTATPTDGARTVIDKVAKALGERPALKMTVTGAADPASEREAVQRAALESRLLTERRRELLRAGAPSDAPVTMSGDDRARLLRELYRQTDLPGKPRNLIGLQKEVPPAEMESMLRAATVVSNESARELALQRGLAVRDALIAKGLPGERLFLAAPKVRGSGEGDGAWTPRVQLLLSTN